MLKRVTLLAAVSILSAVCIEFGGDILAPGKIGFVNKAEAVVGMPLTPVSVAGVARRTVRRCAVGVYNC